MKKRGLIISTIVMMLVVVVALSTATYAWFAVSADAKISTLTVQTAASDGLQIAAVYKYDGSTISASSGTMQLTTAPQRYWKGDVQDYGAELLFESALATAYGVTGDGRPANMYTAASRTATSYVTTSIDDTYWGVGVTARVDDPLTGTPNPGYTEAIDESSSHKYDVDAPGALAAMTGVIYYTNALGTTPAAGAVFQLGSYAGTIENAYINLCNKGYYIRTQGFYTVEVTALNESEFSATDTFYTDNVAANAANVAPFADGVWTPSGSGLMADITTSGLGTVYALAPVAAQITATNYKTYHNEVAATGEDVVIGTVFYTDEAMTAKATGAGFTNGVFTGDDAAAEAALVDLFAKRTVPADVETNWTYEANNSALATGDIPRYLIPAIANSEYFQLNFALKTKRGMVANTEKLGIADIFIKKLAVTASGGMAAASRIALLEYTDNTFATPYVNPNSVPAGNAEPIKYVFEPFSNSKFDTGWVATETPHQSYNIAPASKWLQTGNVKGFAYKYAGTSNFTTDFEKAVVSDNDTAEVIRYDETLVNDESVWATATFFDIDKNADWADKGLYDNCNLETDPEYLASPLESKKLCSVGTFTAANTIKYYQLVIWFEGSDAQCVTGYAGTGITVDLAFDFYQQWR